MIMVRAAHRANDDTRVICGDGNMMSPGKADEGKVTEPTVYHEH